MPNENFVAPHDEAFRDEAPQDASPYDHEWEDALEPRHLIHRVDVILRVGAAMLAAGTGARRVAETMRQVASALDVDSIQTRISLTEILVTVRRRDIYRTQAAEVPNPGVNADQIAALQKFSRDLPKHVTVSEVEERLEEVLHRPRQWPTWGPPVGAGAACSSFCFLNNGRWYEVVAVFVAAICGQLWRREMHKRHLNQLSMSFTAAAVATVVYLGLEVVVRAVAGIGTPLADPGLLSSILFLIPGFPLMTAVLDLARLDLSAGMTRLTYATLLTLSAGLGMWMIVQITHLDPVRADAFAMPWWLLLILQAVASCLGVIGFAIVFNSPKAVAITAGLIALVANPIRLTLIEHAAWPAQTAAALATLIVGLLAFAAGRLGHLPRIILSVPSVVIMIPGAYAFRSLVEFNNGNLTTSLNQGVFALITVAGMAAGLVAARLVTDPQWAFSTPNPPTYATVFERHLAARLHRRRHHDDD